MLLGNAIKQEKGGGEAGLGWRHDIWKRKRRVTHPSVSWKLTFTFFADPRSSERQIKGSMSGFLQPTNMIAIAPSVPCYEQYLTFMIATISYSRGRVRFIHSSSQPKQHFPLFPSLISTERKPRSHYESRCRHISSPAVCMKECHYFESSPPAVMAPYVSVILNIYVIQSMLAHVCEFR